MLSQLSIRKERKHKGSINIVVLTALDCAKWGHTDRHRHAVLMTHSWRYSAGEQCCAWCATARRSSWEREVFRSIDNYCYSATLQENLDRIHELRLAVPHHAQHRPTAMFCLDCFIEIVNSICNGLHLLIWRQCSRRRHGNRVLNNRSPSQPRGRGRPGGP
jgi:hypothetical protein